MEPVALGTIVDCIGAEWVGQKIPDRTLVAEVSTDTRHLSGRPLFVALTGDNFDGHKFVGQAAQRGAVASVVAGLAGDFVDHLCTHVFEWFLNFNFLSYSNAVFCDQR